MVLTRGDHQIGVLGELQCSVGQTRSSQKPRFEPQITISKRSSLAFSADSACLRAVMSRKTMTAPTTRSASLMGVQTYSTENALPSLRQKTSSTTRWTSPSLIAAYIGQASTGYGVPSGLVWWRTSCIWRPNSSSTWVALMLGSLGFQDVVL